MSIAEHAEALPAVGSRVSSGAGGRATSATLVGRGVELDLLVEVLAVAPSVAAVEGEAGIGKTRLISEAAARLAGDGDASGERLRWLVGACRRVREPFPLGPVIEALRGLEDELRGVRLSAVAGALRPLLPELASVLPLQPEPLDDRAAERHRVFRALRELLDGIGRQHDLVVLVMEDLHWMDDQTSEFLTYLLADPPARLSVVLSYRGEEVDASVRAVTAKLPGEVHRTYVVLEPLDAEQTGVLAASILNAERVSGEFAAHLRERASGVPFAIEELLALLRSRGALLREHGRWARKELDELDVPTGIRDPVLERVGRLSAEGRAVVEAAAVLQDPAPVSVLLDVSRALADDAVRGVEEALASGLLVDVGDTVGFRHVLAAQAVYESLSGPRRTALHGRAAQMIEALDPVPLGQLAHHLRHAGRIQAWADAAERAADRAIELGHDAEGVRVLSDVLRHASLEPEQRGLVAVKLGRAANEVLNVPDDLFDLLFQALVRELPAVVRGELQLWLSLAVERTGSDFALARQFCMDAVNDLDDRIDLKAWAMLGLGMAMQSGDALVERTSWRQRVVDLLSYVDEPGFEVFLLGKVAMMGVADGDPSWRVLTARLERATSGAPRRRREVNAYYSVGMTACYAGHHADAERLLGRAQAGALACDSKRLELMVYSELAVLDYCRGWWDGLDERVATLLDEVFDYPLARVDLELAAALLALAHGELRTLRARLGALGAELESMSEFSLLAFAVGSLARLAVTAGESAEATELAKGFVAGVEAHDWWASIPRALPNVIELLTSEGQVQEARQLVKRSSAELADLDVPLAPAALRQSRGFLDAAEGHSADAVEHFLAAAEHYELLQCPYEAAQAREQAGLALLAASDTRGEETTRAALATYERLGATWDAARCTQAARSHGVRLAVPHRGGRKGYGTALSPREEQVARLAGAGLTNKEIGEELFLSPLTVGKHLGRAMRKLGTHTRAAVAARLPADPGQGP